MRVNLKSDKCWYFDIILKGYLYFFFVFHQNKDKETVLDLVIRYELDIDEIGIICKFVISDLKNKINFRLNIVNNVGRQKLRILKQFISEMKWKV